MPDHAQTPNQALSISWDCGEASLQSLGGMLGPVTFRLADGRDVRPLHVAPWEDEDVSDQPPILQRLRGEWPCVPFGMQPGIKLPEPWDVDQSGECDPAAEYPHGFASNHHWRVSSPNPLTLLGEIDYPASSAISSIRRQVTATPGKPELTIELAVTARRDCRLPIGVHPVFALPGEPGSMRLDPGGYGSVWTHPLDELPGLSLFEANRTFSDMSCLPRRDGIFVDACALPYEGASENLLLLTQTTGLVRLINRAERYRTELQWDPEIFPSLMLWISNRGRQARPWMGRHLAIGIEPVRAAFDLGETVSAGKNPLASLHIPTAWDFVGGETLLTEYVLRACE